MPLVGRDPPVCGLVPTTTSTYLKGEPPWHPRDSGGSHARAPGHAARSGRQPRRRPQPAPTLRAESPRCHTGRALAAASIGPSGPDAADDAALTTPQIAATAPPRRRGRRRVMFRPSPHGLGPGPASCPPPLEHQLDNNRHRGTTSIQSSRAAAQSTPQLRRSPMTA